MHLYLSQTSHTIPTLIRLKSWQSWKINKAEVRNWTLRALNRTLFNSLISHVQVMKRLIIMGHHGITLFKIKGCNQLRRTSILPSWDIERMLRRLPTMIMIKRTVTNFAKKILLTLWRQDLSNPYKIQRSNWIHWLVFSQP